MICYNVTNGMEEYTQLDKERGCKKVNGNKKIENILNYIYILFLNLFVLPLSFYLIGMAPKCSFLFNFLIMILLKPL